MAFETVRVNKMRSGLTVLGVVIGITSIVAMTSLIRGFDQSLQDSISAAMGPKTIFIQRFGVTSFASGREFSQLIKRPNLTISDARALGTEHHPGVCGHRDGRRRGADPAAARVLRRSEDAAAARVRHLGIFRRGHAHPDGRRTLSERHRSAAARQLRRVGPHAVSIAVRRPRPRSARQDRAHRQQAVHGDRRVRQTAVARQFLGEPGRFRRHSLHDVSTRVRIAHRERRPQRRRQRQRRHPPGVSDFSGGARGCGHHHRGGGHRADHADPSWAQAGRGRTTSTSSRRTGS